ncbi:Calycin-like protein [Gaertneriomyces semiglobifer]|nr:Calycin-like protein [Gaertneriomyces semiglobifer]
MKTAICLAITLLISATKAAPVEPTQCPPANYSSLSNFNLTEYVSAPWYVQEQLPVNYQTEDELFCVRAKYTLRPDGKSVEVYNYSNKQRVNGEKSDTILRALIRDSNVQSQLLVGPPWIPEFIAPWLYGPYWVVAAEPSPDNYEWALVTGGAPDVQTGNGCTTQGSRFKGGIWILTREQVASQEAVETARNRLTELGIDVNVLKKVEQEGCAYADIAQ